ncbi:tRNA uridine 5-oxyacetic acid(34) methyltransferase CmoM [Mixta tenebrionis]|uniref:tRNA 5-carboxymethoxyuridine methyltransferase n=1 Tax=Mixta tenebrionis TaxID=2562439 RepID=A0A506VG13_9GAMM|nr:MULTISPECIES: tRNA uridine 5-oxyacetic acid(34) methyltransferase CmoM [Mixta]QHM76028.1 tRNA 5-carboxymethoxyuridine methyltransferase [Mixta theicola]TPW44555.1 tRNA uridine 5-oxyacetic acid(34) methyltransferase CmoM [Mixta tenebrionis]
MQDRNFDDIADKFAQNIYGTTKGRIRQAILWQELDALLPTLPARPLHIVDVGGGQGQIACGLAARGHQVLLCDISGEMLQRARANAEQQKVLANMQFKQISAQQLAQHLDKPADLVLFHAVLEWVAAPEEILAVLYNALAPGGILSLMFYNLHGLILQNLAHGNFGWLESGMKKRKKRTLSPDYPRDPQQVYQWLQACGFVIERRAGIRVFHDYMHDKQQRIDEFDRVLAMETQYCRQEPFISLGRYIHVTARKPAQKDRL